ncbi:MAG: DUF2813 domain-containing protein [ANME-2 cluster archaeon]|nr:MAG: DUF2813 domain-containing protein [ANME-2 cluster archaeon]
MFLKQIEISNFKSISHLNFEVKKHGNSYTSMFVGINEVGKSNILQAMSFLETPKEQFNIIDLNNQNNDVNDDVEISFEFEFDNDKTYLTVLKKKMVDSDVFLKVLNIQTITKLVYLRRGKTLFQEVYDINMGDFKFKDYFYSGPAAGVYRIRHKDELNKELAVLFELDKNKLKEILINLLKETIKERENMVSFWKPEK